MTPEDVNLLALTAYPILNRNPASATNLSPFVTLHWYDFLFKGARQLLRRKLREL